MFKKFERIVILFRFDNWLQLLVQRICFPLNGPVIYRTGPLEVLIDHHCGDQDGTRSCLYPGLYDPCFETLVELPRQIRVLDLGANGGGFLLALRKHGFKILDAVAVELNPHTWSRLVLNLYRNIPFAQKRLRIINGAAGGSDGSIRISLGRGSVSDSIVDRHSGGDEEFELPTYSLASLLGNFPESEQIDLCKIDIEGAEYELLRNADEDLLRRLTVIIIEIHNVAGEEPEALIRQLEKSGFKRLTPSRTLVESNVHLFSR